MEKVGLNASDLLVEKEELAASLSGFSIHTGIPRTHLRKIEAYLAKQVDPQISCARLKQSCPELGELALENAFYELALTIGLNCKIETARAQLLLGQQDAVAATKLSSSVFESQVIEMMEARLRGRPLNAKKIFQEVVFEIENQNLQNQAHFYLQAGTLFFTLSDYQVALKNYQFAYEKYEQISMRGKMLVCCHNISTTFYSLNVRSSSNLWLSQCSNQLRSYHLENLQNSLTIFQLEKLNSECRFSASLSLARETLQHGELNPIQEILIYQTAARSQIELGMLYSAEMDLLKSRMLMHQRQIYQHEAQQLALEKDLEVLSGQKLKVFEKKRDHSNQDTRFLTALKIAECREALLKDEKGLAESLYSEISRAPLHVGAHLLNQDLKFQFEKDLCIDKTSPRLLESILFESTRNPHWISYLNHITEMLEGAWGRCIFLFISASRLMKTNPQEAGLRLEHGFRTAEENGFVRWRIYFDFALSQINHSEIQSQKLQSTLEINELKRAAQLFRAYFALPQRSLSTIKTQNAREVTFVDASEVRAQRDLVIETATEKVYFQNEEVTILKNSILYKILVAIAQSDSGLSKQELIEQVWGYEYDPETHDALVFNNLRRLRDMVPVVLIQGYYRIATHISWALITAGIQSDLPISALKDRHKDVLRLLNQSPGTIARRDLVEALGISERTALRELTLMVELGLLLKQGQGRSVAYELNKRSEAEKLVP